MTSSSATVVNTPRHPDQRRAFVPWPLSPTPDGVTIVSGPAGSGKTALLSQWFQLLTDAGARPAWSRGAAPMVVDDLINDASRPVTDDERIFFVDDADHLRGDELDELVDRLEAAGGGGWRLIVAGRGPLRAEFAGLGHDRQRVLNHRQLVLDDEAIFKILSSYRADLGLDHLRTLADKLGGWAAGAHLAGRAIRSLPCPDEAVTNLSGTDALISEYLEDEVFGALDRTDQEFLVTCSVLAELTPQSCALVTGSRFSAERLIRLSSINALISEEPEGGRWQWRPFARDFLDARLRQRPAAEVAELRRRARGWSTAQRGYDNAIDQGMAAGDWNAVVGLVLQTGPRLTGSGHPADVLRWVGALPRSILGTEAGLSVVAAMALWASEGDDARSAITDWLAHAEAVAIGRAPGRAPSVATAASIVRAAFGGDRPSRRIDLARSVIAHEEGLDQSWRALACWAIGMAAYVDDDPKTARAALTDYLNVRSASGDEHDRWFDPRLTAGAMGTLALIELDYGNPERADILLSASALYADPEPSPSVGTGTVGLARAVRALHRGDLGDATTMLTEVASRSMLHEVRVLGLLELAQAYAELDMPARRRHRLAEADCHLRTMRSPGRLLARRRNTADVRSDPAEDHRGGGTMLTEREVEVLRLLGSELSRRQIAEELFLAHNTVKTYVQRLYRKLGVSSRAAAVARGRERGWIP